MCIFNIAFFALLFSSCNRSFLISTFLTYLFPFSIVNTVELPILFRSYATDIKNQQEFHYSLLSNIKEIQFICLGFYVLSFSLLVSYFLKNRNLARKCFHFFGFFIYTRNSRFYIQCSELLIYLMAAFSKTDTIKSIFKVLIKNNPNKDAFSHILLVASYTYPYFFLNSAQYLRLCITIGILDSMASIAGIALRKKKKSFMGFAVGQLFSWIFELIYAKKISFQYHLFMGLVEYFCTINDNITLSLSSVIYQKYAEDLLIFSFKK